MTNFKEQITILGFSGVQIEDANTFFENFRKQNKGAPIQFFDAKHVAGKDHLYFAAVNALTAFEGQTNISNSLAVEALLYASAQRQITRAVEQMGVKQDSSDVAVLIMADKPQTDGYVKLVTKTVSAIQDDSVLELTSQKMEKIKELFEISDPEYNAKLQQGREKQALTELVIERMALLGTRS